LGAAQNSPEYAFPGLTMMTTISIFLLMIINGFFVGVGFSLVKMPVIQIQSLAAEGVFLTKLTLTIKRSQFVVDWRD